MANIDNDTSYPVETSWDDTDQIIKIDKGATLVKKTAWSVVKSTLKTYFDTLYQAIGSYSPSGWNAVSDTWTYASASTITVPAGATSIYGKFDKIRWKQGGGWKYGALAAVADALLTIVVNTDHVVANSAITDVYYSKSENPLDFPHWFNFNPAPTGYSAAPASAVYRFKVSGKQMSVHMGEDSDGTSNATTKTYAMPVAAAYTTGIDIPVSTNNGVVIYQNQGYISGTTLNAFVSNVTVWTNSGACAVFGGGGYGLHTEFTYAVA